MAQKKQQKTQFNSGEKGSPSRMYCNFIIYFRIFVLFIYCIYILVFVARSRTLSLSLAHTLFFYFFFWRRRPHRTPGYRTLNVQRRQTLVIITRQSVSFSYAVTPTATATAAETETETELLLLLLGTAASRSGRINKAKRQRLNLRLCCRRQLAKTASLPAFGLHRRRRRRRRRHWLLISWPRE